MKIETLAIRGYKNLANVRVDLSQASSSVVLVGPNGSGKSNLLEAIATIFRDLSWRRHTGFEYRISYVLRSRRVVIENDDGGGVRFAVSEPGAQKPIPMGADAFYQGQSLLPTNVFAYASGSRGTLESLFLEDERSYYRFARGMRVSTKISSRYANTRILRTFFYGRLSNAPLVALSYFSGERGSSDKLLRETLHVEGFDCALLTMRRPTWFKRASGEMEFPWDTVTSLDNELGEFLRLLWRVSLAPISETAGSRSDRLHLFLPTQGSLALLREWAGSEQSLFSLFETLARLQILDTVDIWVKREGVREELAFQEMSDGEKQLLTIVGLLYLTPGEETLFLLDEPDTHLNPSWKWNFLETIEGRVDPLAKSQFILTSHDPLTVAGLSRQDLQVFYTDDEGETRVDHPAADPKGLGVAGVLRGVFGMSSTLDSPTQKLIDERNALLASATRDPDSVTRLHELNNVLRRSGVSIQNPEDMVERILREINIQNIDRRVLTPEQIAKQNSEMRIAVQKLKQG